jgi:hypothetical protein
MNFARAIQDICAQSDTEITDAIVASPGLDAGRQRHAARQENADTLLDRDVGE